MNTITVVVTVGYGDDAESGGARRFHIVGRIADHQTIGAGEAEVIRGILQRHRIRLLARRRVAGDDQLEVLRQTLGREQIGGETAGLVGHAGEVYFAPRQPFEPFGDAGINSAAPADVVRVQPGKAGKRPVEQFGLRFGLHFAGQEALDETLDAVADPGARVIRVPQRQAQLAQHCVAAPGQVRQAVDQRAVEVEQHQSDMAEVDRSRGRLLRRAGSIGFRPNRL